MGTTDVGQLQGGLGDEGLAEPPNGALKISAAARSERLERRIAGLERQLALRIDHEEELQRAVSRLQLQLSTRESEFDAELASARAQLADRGAELKRSQAELAALLNTKTMRLARQPRRLYADLRANPTARKLLSRIRR